MSNQKQNALKDYIEVNVRIEKFWEKYPDGRIQTELVSWENGIVVMKAQVYKNLNDPIPSANGFAYEKEGSSYINKTSALENCETSAVGRALALLGFEIKRSVASKEDVENSNEQANQPEESKKHLIFSKWKLVGGAEKAFNPWYEEQLDKGVTETQMEALLTKRLLKKQEEEKAGA
ncbi:hypothetical protein BhaS171_00044 [Bacillus phage vB_BhaS-171]|uniref:hypothetical protein n=1 Tax=Bacillus phage vB_BhaS-171 TaxID=1775140 RepID=UPI000744CFB1|nr:hypothetical protein BH781_gp44 [Bacillus phage vB_BhaS-171]ALY08100.1 hypothetical protein BhaS171_00044 [Bacillus phage vB_BhaS-171]